MTDEVKEKLVALRMTPDDLAQIDAATRRFAGGILEPSRSQMMRLLLRLGLARIKTATAEELARLVVGGSEPEATREEQLRSEVALKRKVEADLDAAEAQRRADEATTRRKEAELARDRARLERMQQPAPKVWRTDDPNNPDRNLLRPRP